MTMSSDGRPKLRLVGPITSSTGPSTAIVRRSTEEAELENVLINVGLRRDIWESACMKFHEALRSALEEGCTHRELAQMLGWTETKVRAYVREHVS